MSIHTMIAKRTDTRLISESMAPRLLGKNVRSPSLQRNEMYIMNTWRKSGTSNSDNPYSTVVFLGCGTEAQHNAGTYNEDNYKLKELGEGQYYWFRAYDVHNKEEYTFGAYGYENCLVVGSGALRVTFYEVDSSSNANKGKTAPSKPARTPHKVKLAVEPENEDEPSLLPVDDCEDDDCSVIAYECNPRTMQPYDRTAPRTYANA